MKLSNLLVSLHSVQAMTKRPMSIHIPKKICRDCKHFIADKRECSIFVETHLVSVKINYESAGSARRDEKMCGEEAVFFEKNQYKIITVPYYFLKDYWVLTISGVYVTLMVGHLVVFPFPR